MSDELLPKTESCMIDVDLARYAHKCQQERDKLEIENKRLAALLECSQGDMRQAQKIMDRDIKDAARYRWACANLVDLGSWGDAQVDEAMAREAQ